MLSIVASKEEDMLDHKIIINANVIDAEIE